MAIQLTLRGLALPEPPATVEAARSLWAFPDLPAGDLCQNAALLGAAGEALVDSLLLRHGLLPMTVPGSLQTDRLVYVPGGLVRMQVKACCAPREGAYHFTVARGYRGAPQGVRAYGPDDYDVLALVCLSADAVAFTTERRPSYRVPVSALPGLRADPRASLEECLHRLGLDPRDGARGHAPEADARPDPSDAPDADFADLVPPCAA